MEDSISRQAAIDALMNEASHDGAYGYIGKQDIVKVLNALPTAQPEIIRCKDCKHRFIENDVWECPFGLMGGENFFCGYGTLGRARRGER